jgi:hypothetical protein
MQQILRRSELHNWITLQQGLPALSGSKDLPNGYPPSGGLFFSFFQPGVEKAV